MKRIVLLTLFLSVSLTVSASTGTAPNTYLQIQDLMSPNEKQRQAAARKFLESPNLSLVPGMVDAIFYTPRNSRKELIEVLEEFTGENLGEDYYTWVELVGKRTDIKPGPGYVEWKVSLLSRIDPAYKKVLYKDVLSDIRLEEIVWGGAKLDGIPALTNPPTVLADQVPLSADEKVFGLTIGNESRAYPLRFLGWHEMANDILGGQRITLSY
jgi:Protein of unknown function (DUF3179)